MTLTCLGRFSEGVHILQGSSLLVGDPCQPLGPCIFSLGPEPSQALSLPERLPKFALSRRDSASSQPVVLPNP